MRRNGSILGNTNSIGSGGIYNLSDAYNAARAGLWPTSPLNWPTAYSNLINGFSGTKYYIDAVNGNDSNSGTIAAPLKTMGQFVTLTNSTSGSIMAVLYPGTYNQTALSVNGGSVCFYDNNNARTLVGFPGKCFLTYTANTGDRDSEILAFQNASSAAYGITFQRNNNSRTTNYTVAMFGHPGSSSYFAGKMYNCVFQETNANNAWSLGYANNGFPAGAALNYCTFAVNAASAGDYSGSGMAVNSCFFNYTYTSSSNTFSACETGSAHTLNFTTYKSTEATASGIAYGTYAWP
jgi:hypothetical protein